jgi:hypothetical protein
MDHIDFISPDGHDLGHGSLDHAGNFALTDALGESVVSIHEIGPMDELFDNQLHSLGSIDSQGQFTIDGVQGHIESDGLGGLNVVDDLHPENTLHVENGADGDSVSTANYLPLFTALKNLS